MRQHYFIIVTTFLVSVLQESICANVLVVAPFPALSHFQMLEPLLVNLAKRGHHVTVLSHFPRPNAIPNYTDIDLRDDFPPFELEFKAWDLVEDLTDLFRFGQEHCKALMNSKKILKFLSTPLTFDLIVLDAFDTDCSLGFALKYSAPFIVYCPMALPVWLSDWIYNPTEIGYVPENLCRLTGSMDFYDRLKNVGCHLLFRWLNWVENTKPSLDIIRKMFGVNIDSLAEIKSNASLVLVNSFHGITGIRPFLPNVLEIGGIHLKPTKPLPEVSFAAETLFRHCLSQNFIVIIFCC